MTLRVMLPHCGYFLIRQVDTDYSFGTKIIVFVQNCAFSVHNCRICEELVRQLTERQQCNLSTSVSLYNKESAHLFLCHLLSQLPLGGRFTHPYTGFPFQWLTIFQFSVSRVSFPNSPSTLSFTLLKGLQNEANISV